jgi:hypothetical protein
MTQINRLFDSSVEARAAFDELKERRFEDVELLLAADNRAPRSIEDLVEAIKRAGVEPSRADVYADGVRRGGAFVSVRAPFGSAVRATEILDRHGATTTPKPIARRRDEGTTDANARVRTVSGQSDRKASPASGPSESSGRVSAAPPSRGPRTLSQMLGIPELIDSNTFFSGFPLLIRPQPVSPPSRDLTPSAPSEKQTPQSR